MLTQFVMVSNGVWWLLSNLVRVGTERNNDEGALKRACLRNAYTINRCKGSNQDSWNLIAIWHNEHGKHHDMWFLSSIHVDVCNIAYL